MSTIPYKYAQRFHSVHTISSGLPTTFHMADSPAGPVRTPTDTYLRLHADASLGVAVQTSNPPPSYWWMEFTCFIMATWTQDSVPAYISPSGVFGGDVLGMKQLTPVPFVPADSELREIVRFATEEPLLLTRARKPDGSTEGGGQLACYIAYIDPAGAISTFNDYSVILRADLTTRTQWGSTSPV